MTKEESKELDQVTKTEPIEEAKEDQEGEGVAEVPKASAPSKKVKAAKKGSAKKEDLKSVLGELKSKRQAALESGDKVQLKRIRGRYKKANRLLQRSVASKA
jgi:hypothetical protein